MSTRNVKRITKVTCTVTDCDKEQTGKAEPPLCHSHRHRRHTGNYEASKRGMRKRPCEFKGCKNNGHSLGLCPAHYQQQRRGVPLKPLREATGTYINSDGYVVVYVPERSDAPKNGWMMEHRVVMADFLGRGLYDNENVHHINGKRDDNRLENLELWMSSQPSGQRAQDLYDWALTLTRQYENDMPKLRKLRKMNRKSTDAGTALRRVRSLPVRQRATLVGTNSR